MLRIASMLLQFFLLSSPIQSTPVPFDYQHILAAEQPLQGMSPETGNIVTICTATAIGDGYHWLTAAHCTDGNTYIRNEQTTLVFRNTISDLSVVKTERAHANPLKVQHNAPEVGQRVFMVGHPVGLSAQYFQGTISSLATEVPGEIEVFMMFDMVACGGNSGSAVVNKHDEIVSVLQIGYGRPCSSFSGGAQWAQTAYVVQKYGRE